MSIQAQPHPVLLLAGWLIRSMPTVCVGFAAGVVFGYPQGLIQQPAVLLTTRTADGALAATPFGAAVPGIAQALQAGRLQTGIEEIKSLYREGAQCAAEIAAVQERELKARIALGECETELFK